MAFFSIQHIKISGISAAVPKNTVSNFDLEGFTKDELEKLISTVGIENRRVAPQYMCASDLCITAAENLITELKWNKADIDVLFFVSQTPDYILPGSSMHIAERLSLQKSCITFDINQGCAGYVYGLSLITSFMSASKLSKGLLLVGDTITKLISKNDKSLSPIFSDCGTATALNYDALTPKIDFNISSEGKDFEAIIVQEGGARKPNGSNKNLAMKGLDVFNFSLKKVVPNVEELLNKSNQTINNIDYFVFHQANKLILEAISKKLNIEKNKVPSTLKNFGNTSGATIPLTIVSNLNKNGNIVNSKILLSGFGVGLSLASAIINFNEVICCEIIEL
jgi:3-oxoacyl-[acyl-carrier-protein] synthase III